MQVTRKVRLLFNDQRVGGHSDKEYQLQLVADSSQFAVAAQYGRRGGPLASGYLSAGGGWSKVPVYMTEGEAQKAYAAKRADKLSGGYVIESESSEATPAATPAANGAGESAGEPPCELLTELDEQTEFPASGILTSADYWMQEKANGRRLLIRKRGGRLDGINRKGQIITLAPEIAADAAFLPWNEFLLDGEHVDGFVGFDVLYADRDLKDEPYETRFGNLLGGIVEAARACGAGLPHLRAVRTWFDVNEKPRGLFILKENHAEGAVFKRIDAPFRPGRNGQHLKVKFVKTLTAKVIEKNAKDAAKGHNSVALGLLRDGEWVEVGHASTIGKGVIVVGQLVECRYLYAYGSKLQPRLVQARIVATRPELTDEACRIEQIQYHQGQGGE